MDSKLISVIEAAMRRQQVYGIEGWGLDNPDPATFEIAETEPASGCTSETCNHVSHDPAAATYKLIPITGHLVHLGGDVEANEVSVDYYALTSPDAEVVFYELLRPRYYYSRVRKVDSVPDWALLALAQQEVKP